jgi:hypothetical protein
LKKSVPSQNSGKSAARTSHKERIGGSEIVKAKMRVNVNGVIFSHLFSAAVFTKNADKNPPSAKIVLKKIKFSTILKINAVV